MVCVRYTDTHTDPPPYKTNFYTGQNLNQIENSGEKIANHFYDHSNAG